MLVVHRAARVPGDSSSQIVPEGPKPHKPMSEEEPFRLVVVDKDGPAGSRSSASSPYAAATRGVPALAKQLVHAKTSAKKPFGMNDSPVSTHSVSRIWVAVSRSAKNGYGNSKFV